MIKLESAHIEEMRGIRKLDIDFHKSTFAISGPNGSGKSGVIDAIEFGLTGQIGRLTGRGTGGTSMRNTGLTSIRRNFRMRHLSSWKVFLTGIGKTATTITRKISAPKRPKNCARRQRRESRSRGNCRSSRSHAVTPRDPPLYSRRAD